MPDAATLTNHAADIVVGKASTATSAAGELINSFKFQEDKPKPDFRERMFLEHKRANLQKLILYAVYYKNN